MPLFSLAAARQTGRFSDTDNREDSSCGPSVLQIRRTEYEEALCTFATISRFFDAVRATTSRNLFFNV